MNAVNDIVFKADGVQGNRLADIGSPGVQSSGGTTQVSDNRVRDLRVIHVPIRFGYFSRTAGLTGIVFLRKYLRSGDEWGERGTCLPPPNNAILEETKIVNECRGEQIGGQQVVKYGNQDLRY